ncbi:MAG: putative Ig domain-containing protein [Nitrospirota bacterium]
MKFATPTLLMIVAILIGGCTAEPTSLAPPSKPEKRPLSVDGSPANDPPIIRSAGIFPVNVSLESTLQVDIQGEDKDGDPIQYQYQWIVNGVPAAGITGPQFLTAQLKKGDEIGVELIPSDGKVNGAVFKTSLVMVGNTAPRIDEIHMEPAPVHRGEILKARVTARDPDGDPVQFSYKWFRNGKELPGQQADTLDTTPFHKKDVLRVLVTASDGQIARDPLFGMPMTIENAPPRITSTPSTALNNGQYLYQVIATDPDEDTLSYELKEAPSGMAIEAATGKLIWRLTSESKGKHHVVIVAKDNENGHTEQEFDLDGQTAAQLEAQTPTTPPTSPAP